MPSDLSVSRIGVAAASPPSGPEPRPTASAAPAAGMGDERLRPRRDGVGAEEKALPNPALRLDPGLAIVVIEFRDGDGRVRETIPTQAQLDAYRSWQRSNGGDVPVPPPGGREAAPGRATGSAAVAPAAGGAEARGRGGDAGTGQGFGTGRDAGTAGARSDPARGLPVGSGPAGSGPVGDRRATGGDERAGTGAREVKTSASRDV